jgi:beta-glucosidase
VRRAGSEQLAVEEADRPRPGPLEALVRVHAAAITRDELDPSRDPGRDPSMTADRIVEAARTHDTFADLGTARVRYASSNPKVATADSHGLLTARSAGVTTIQVTVDGVTGTTPIVVR